MVTYPAWSGYSPYGNPSFLHPAMMPAYAPTQAAPAAYPHPSYPLYAYPYGAFYGVSRPAPYPYPYPYLPPYAHRNDNGNNNGNAPSHQWMPQPGGDYSNYLHRMVELSQERIPLDNLRGPVVDALGRVRI